MYYILSSLGGHSGPAKGEVRGGGGGRGPPLSVKNNNNNNRHQDWSKIIFYNNSGPGYYRRIYFEAIYLIVNAIDLRFNQPGYVMYEGSKGGS